MEANAEKGNGAKARRWATAGIALLAVSLVGGFCYWLYARNRESTDDAAIDGHIMPISSKVAGQVLRVYVDDNQKVRRGDLLVEIDPKDYEVRLGQAKAELAAAQAEARKAEEDAGRYQRLFERDQVSRQTYDHALTGAEVARADAAVAREKLEAAELDLSYTKITAPEDGKIARKSVEIRTYVEVGQPLMVVVSTDVWVTADFKETQLSRMRPGQPVDIHVDTYRHHVFRGHIDSIQSGTGARFSLLPPENATGNFVKVVQRVPVKIVFDETTEGYLLAPGMSVEPVVRLK